jgi:hypothetical protein
MSITSMFATIIAIIALCLLIAYGLYRKGKVRAGFKCAGAMFFIEAEEQSPPRIRSSI